MAGVNMYDSEIALYVNIHGAVAIELWHKRLSFSLPPCLPQLLILAHVLALCGQLSSIAHDLDRSSFDARSTRPQLASSTT